MAGTDVLRARRSALALKGRADMACDPRRVTEDAPGAWRRWERAVVALGSLVVVYGVGFGVLVAGGAIAHAALPSRHVDLFAALHDQWVVGALLGVSVLWLLPPYPWAKRVVTSRSREQPAETAGGSVAVRRR